MRIDRTIAAEADRLNEFWDGIMNGKAPPGESTHRSILTEQQLETLVLYLESMKPLATPSQRENVLGATNRILATEVPMNTPASVRAPAPETIVQPGARGIGIRLAPVVRAFDRIAAVLLILILVAGLVLIGPGRNLMDSVVPARFASMLGVNDDTSTGESFGSHSMITVEVQPGDYEGGHVEVGLWQVSLPPGSTMAAAPTSVEQPVTFGFAVSSGAVVFMSNGEEQTVGPDGSVGGHPGLAYVRNATADPAILLVLAPASANATFPLTIGPWVAAGSPVASPVMNLQSMDTEPVLIGSVDLTGQKAFQYRVLVTETVLAPGMGLGDVRVFGPPTARLRAVAVREGRVAIVTGSSLATPTVAQELVPGDAVQLEADGVWSSDLRVTGSENATVLGLLTMPAADNHTLNQSIESVAPFWGEWTVPAPGEVNLAVRRLTLQPGATYSLPTEAGVLYHIASGNFSVVNSVSGYGAPVEAGGTLAQAPGTVLKLVSAGNEPATIIQALVFDGPLHSAIEREHSQQVEFETLVEATGILPAGEVSVMLEASRFNGSNDGGGASQGGHSLALVTSADGEIQVSRLGGNAQVIPADDGESFQPSLGENVRIGVGSSLLVQLGGGWAITGASGSPSLGLVLTVSPAAPNPSPAIPIASPDATVPGSWELVGNADACDVAPLTSPDIDSVVATPSASISPPERSLRDQDGGRFGIDAAAGVVAEIQSYADCLATGDYTLIYAHYSDQAIRDRDVIQDLVRSRHDSGGDRPVQVTIEDVEYFPDFRVGARVVIDGEAAYLTFIQEDGRWKIDVWDDINGGRVHLATPDG